ncbi:DUF29 domain-containing protein [Roseiarcus fermentans]|uniref:DUF29 domain-containing protein n=1 Tax=Roseiarcus fermentans TaxID=1473586 RepID=UPI001FDF1EDE|nr:DUF29 domain-containing protein [Roseiarcus fermentans]
MSRAPAREADPYSWARRQADLLRAGRLGEIDPAGLAEEIDDLGEEQYDKLESALRVVLLHLLKWDHQPERRSRTWAASIREQRRRVLRRLRKNPGLKSRLEEALADAYEDACDEASGETGLPLTDFPVVRPYEYAEFMDRPVVWPGDE